MTTNYVEFIFYNRVVQLDVITSFDFNAFCVRTNSMLLERLKREDSMNYCHNPTRFQDEILELKAIALDTIRFEIDNY